MRFIISEFVHFENNAVTETIFEKFGRKIHLVHSGETIARYSDIL